MPAEEEPEKPFAKPETPSNTSLERTIDISITPNPTLITPTKSTKVEVVQEKPDEHEAEEELANYEENNDKESGNTLGEQFRKIFRNAAGTWLTLLDKFLEKIKASQKPKPEPKKKPEPAAQIEDTATLEITDAPRPPENILEERNLVDKSNTVVAQPPKPAKPNSILSRLSSSLKKLLLKPKLKEVPPRSNPADSYKVNRRPSLSSKVEGDLLGSLGNQLKKLGDTIANDSSQKPQTVINFLQLQKNRSKFSTSFCFFLINNLLKQ
jgi:hypothetical protein